MIPPSHEDDESFKGEFQAECDLCAASRERDMSIKTVKHKFGAILCKECFICVKAINR
jgi:hypothetical protein